MTNFVTNYFYDLPEDLQQMIWLERYQSIVRESYELNSHWSSSFEWCEWRRCINCGDCKEQCQYECFEECDVIIYHPERNYDELGKVRQYKSDPYVMTVVSESDEEED